jgi:hypothetical protein
MRQGGATTFFRFVLGFTTFIALSFFITYAVSTISIAQEKERQVGAAFQVLVGGEEKSSWWTVLFK